MAREKNEGAVSPAHPFDWPRDAGPGFTKDWTQGEENQDL